MISQSGIYLRVSQVICSFRSCTQSFTFVHQVLIPISLYVSIEIVKLGQIYFIHNDLALYNEQLDSRIQCRALNITEDLGQIQYLFSDKTGTLTENKMVFRRCSIYGVDYPHEDNGENSCWKDFFCCCYKSLKWF